MKTVLRAIARQWTPPIVVEAARHLRASRARPEWEWLPGGFAQASADPNVKGWNQASVLETYRERFEGNKARLQSDKPFGFADARQPSEVGDWIAHNVAASFGCVLGHVAGHKKRLSILDWGGALGHYLFLARALRPELEFDYTVQEMPLLAECGPLINPDARFCHDQSALREKFDLVFASCTLHYDEDWRHTFTQLAACASTGLFVTRLPVTLSGDSYVFVQRPYAYGYQTEYAGWCLSRNEIFAAGQASGLSLHREFLVGEKPPIVGAPSPCEYRGFLWLRSPDLLTQLPTAM